VAENQDGDLSARGTAVAQLPSRAGQSASKSHASLWWCLQMAFCTDRPLPHFPPGEL